MDQTTAERYLERIGSARPARPDAGSLRSLHLAHLRSVPFENLSIHLGEPIRLDEDGLLAVCDREDISMCGVRPTAAVLSAAKALGATRAELVRHATSGAVSGDRDSVVGYAGVVVS